MVHPFVELKPELEHFLAIVRPLANRAAQIDQVAKRLTQPGVLGHYEDVRAQIAVPIVVQATICEREDGADFTKSPAQGDPWNRVSIHVPRGIGPFPDWTTAAVYSWTHFDNLAKNSAPWSMPYACWKWEAYNGFGYRAHGIPTPYVWGGTNVQKPGKFVADGKFNASVWDMQLGCVPVALRMIELKPELSFGQAIAQITAPSIIPAIGPVPAAVGGDLTGAKWVQASLNKVEQLVDPLAVDGSYGRRTKAAIMDFQRAHGLPVTGYVDDSLCTAIDAALAAMGANT